MRVPYKSSTKMGGGFTFLTLDTGLQDGGLKHE